MFRTPERLTPRQKQRRKILARALRSGKYKRGMGYLCHDGCYCPQGVAIDVALKHKWVEGKWLPYLADGVKGFSLNGSYPGMWEMPKEVADIYGFTEIDLENIIQLNDSYGVGQTVIASGIERDDLRALRDQFERTNDDDF
jgi:hypothetical protein